MKALTPNISKYKASHGASLIAQLVKNLPAMQETWIRSLSWEDLLEKEMATHFQYSCLENPMGRGAWQATVHGIARVGHDLVTKPPPPLLYMHAKWLQSCPTFCDPVDCSPLGSSVHGIFQATILEWVAISYSMGSSDRKSTRLNSSHRCTSRMPSSA